MERRSCFVVGQGAIALKCLEILAESYAILGVYSEDRSLLTWAESRGIVHPSNRSKFESLLLDQEYDYLFSINNGWIVPEPILMRARQATINYHNSPLPKYAGVNATTWALIHGETEHAVTWHEVTAAIDAGRILKQVRFPVSADDTALSVNTRCAEVAVAAFAELVDELAADRVVALPQDFTKRSYFGRSDRPSAAGVLNWLERTETLRNLVRALDFGPTHNPIGMPKLWLPGGVVAVGAARAIPVPAYPAGQVLRLESDSVQVATADGSLLLSGLTTLAGAPLSEAVLRDRYGVSVGTPLPLLTTDQRQAIDQQTTHLCRHERTWSQRLAQLTPFVHPYLSDNKRAEKQRIAIALPGVSTEFQLAVFAAYCARLAAADEPAIDLALQTETQRRLIPELFASAVPLRVQIQERETFAQFRDRLVEQLAHIDRLGSYALDLIVRESHLRDTVSGSLPVAIVQAERPDTLSLETLDSRLTFVTYTNGSPPEIYTDAINTANCAAIIRQLQTFAAACLTHSQQALHTLPLLSNAEMQQVLVEWNQTTKPYPQRCIHDLIAEQASRTPDAIAVCFGEAQLTYRELDRRSNQLAHRLIQLGVAPETRVALCLPRGVELLVGLLGILKAGGAYVPIDPTYPVERINAVLSDSCPSVVVTTTTLQKSCFAATETICLDNTAALQRFAATPPDVRVTPANLAYIIYTSGSTGKPKGVEIEHRSLVNHSWAIADIYALGCHDRLLQSASISFDVAGEQIYPTLLRGGTVVIRPDDLLDSFDRFTRFLDAQRITALVLPTAFWHEWVAELSATKPSIAESLRVLGVGTEKVSANRFDQWQQLTGGRVAFFQGYGPTEATITCTVYQAEQGIQPTTLPIGRPLPNTEIYILDPRLQPVPVGVVGELYIGGDSLARGYHRQLELSERQFIPHPFRPGARLYKTGDFARFESSGDVVYVGRADHQIKLNGFRIELGEVEAVLNRHRAVKQAIVHPYFVADGCRLIAYVVLQQDIPVAELQAAIAGVLPSYMVPKVIVPLAALPLLPNGKVNRRALPPPQPQGITAPRDTIEQQLLQLWQAILGIDAIGIHDDFFAIGGSSLAAVRLADQIQTTFGRKLPLATVFQSASIEQLAEILRQAETPVQATTLVALQTTGDRPPLFLLQGVDLYRSLAAQLPNQPVYGLASELNPSFQFQRVEEFAAQYIKELRTIQPHGPYFLGGASFGGLVAFEVAQQLQDAGETIALLALFDSLAPNAFRKKPWLQRLLGHGANLAKFGPRYLAGKLERKLRSVAYRWLQLRLRYRLTPSAPSQTDQYKFVREAYEQIAVAYQPQSYAGRITLFLATHRSAIDDSVVDPNLVDIDPLLGWGNLAKDGIEVYEVPGNHLSIFQEPQVHLLAQQLKGCLQEDAIAVR